MENKAENEKLVRGAVGIPLISKKSPSSTAMSSILAQGKNPPKQWKEKGCTLQ